MKALVRRFLEHRRFPLAAALAAIVLMLPSLKVGLFGDDLVQRLNQFPPGQLPARILDTGFVAEHSGRLGTVLNSLFGYIRGREAALRAMDYGIAPWWAAEGWTAALWRPVTAFSHWLDYRLYPDSPALMHAQNIVWFALAAFLVAVTYRRVEALTGRGRGAQPGAWVAGLAACLWLLDSNTYVPAAYVANRGFFIALVFGLLCFLAHLRWRAGHSRGWMAVSACCLALSLLANEGGASTLAFPLAYALLLEPGGWRPRLSSLAPSLLVVIAWRLVYVGLGHGVKHFPGYVDPGIAPGLFFQHLLPRMNGLLGGQLAGLPPELGMALNARWQWILALVFAGFSLVCALVFLPVLRRDRAARFWAAVLVLALVPAATVFPMSKNLAFVAVGAYGVIAPFLAGPWKAWAALPGFRRALGWAVALWLLIAHVAGPAGNRVLLALASPAVPRATADASEFPRGLDVAERDVVVVNAPAMRTAWIPFYRVYRGESLPRSLRTLVPGSVPFELSRPSASTLVLRAKERDLFDCPDLGPVHLFYFFRSFDSLIYGGMTWKRGDRVTRKGVLVDILEVSPRGAPRAVAFTFAQPLENDGRLWLNFEWRLGALRPFALPRIGETVSVAMAGGPR